MSQGILQFAGMNFALIMFDLAVIFIIVHRFFLKKRLSEYEIVYRWLALFGLGFVGIYAFIMHAFFPREAAIAIGWLPSPFQFEVAIADLALGVLGILSFRASYGFRAATVIAALICLWGAAFGHLYQVARYQNFMVGNAGSWLWMDILIPLILLVCVLNQRRVRK